MGNHGIRNDRVRHFGVRGIRNGRFILKGIELLKHSLHIVDEVSARGVLQILCFHCFVQLLFILIDLRNILFLRIFYLDAVCNQER